MRIRGRINSGSIRTKRQKVEQLKRDYNFKGLYHFTDFSNLGEIFESGYLYSRNDCYRNNTKFNDGASHEVLDRAEINGRGIIKDCVRFYYRTNTPTLFCNEGVKSKEYCNETHIPMPVYLLFDENLIYDDYVVYSDGNATNHETKFGNSDDFFINMDWYLIFSEGPYGNYRGTYEEKKRKRQAELLSLKPISIEKYLKEIIFRCPADMMRAENVYGENDKYVVNNRLFSNKNSLNIKTEYLNNYIWAYNNFIRKNIISMCLFFQYFFDVRGKHDLKISIIYKDKTIKSVELYSYENNKSNEICCLKRITRERIAIEIFNAEKIKKVEIYINNCLYVEEFYNYKMEDDIF